MKIVDKLKQQWAKGVYYRFEICAAIVFMLLLIPTLRGISSENDFNIFYGAAQRLRGLQNMYLGPYMYGMWYYYSPLFASALIPFTFLSLWVLKLVWHFFGFFLIFRLYHLLHWFIPVPKNQNGIFFILTVCITAFHPVFLNLLYGQMTILVLWCSMEGIYRAYRNQYIRSALSFGIGINIKVLPVFFFYHFFLKKNIKMIVWLIAAIAFFMCIPYLYLPFDFHTQIMKDWLGLLNPLNSEHVNTVGEGGFSDFASLVTKYLTEISIPNERTMGIANLNNKEVLVVQMVFRVLILLLTAVMFLKINKRLFTGKLKEYADMAFILVCIPTAFPHQRDYSLLLCLPAFSVLGYLYFIAEQRPGKIIVSFTLIAITLMGCTIFFEIFGHNMKQFLYESRINGFGTLLFIIVYVFWLARVTPVKQVNNLD